MQLRELLPSRYPDLTSGDAFLSSELFSAPERPGLDSFLDSTPAMTIAVYHDAIPLKYPEITWRQSVSRHPFYLKALASFSLVLAVSESSRAELLDYWRWSGLQRTPPVKVISLGADFLGDSVSPIGDSSKSRKMILGLGILEPRKNQILLLRACERLWRDGKTFDLVLVGRVNPQFGKPVREAIRRLRSAGFPIQHHARASDERLLQLYRQTYFTVFPSRAEGAGLPIRESLWAGVPCVCSDIPVLREFSSGGGCLEFRDNDEDSLIQTIRRLLDDSELHHRLVTEISERPLPTWKAAGQQILDELRTIQQG